MKDYNHLTPSEIAYIVNLGKVNLANHFYFTLMDLQLKQVIEVPKGFRIVIDPKVNYEYDTFLGRGHHFDVYKPLPHEVIFTDIFNSDPNLKLTILQIMSHAFKKINAWNSYDAMFQEYEHLKEYLDRKKFFNLFNTKFLTDRGERLRAYLKESLAAFTNLYKNHVPDDYVEDAINQLGSKIILIPNLKLDLIFNHIRKSRNYDFNFFGATASNQKKVTDQYLDNLLAFHISFKYFYTQTLAQIERDDRWFDQVYPDFFT